MLLNNFIKMIGYSVNNNPSGLTQYTKYDGSGENQSATGIYEMLTNYGRIMLGTSENPTLKSSDYMVDDTVLLTRLSDNIKVNPAEGVCVIFSSSYRNDTSSPVTITNIGICAANGSSDMVVRILLTKEVLETPITIHPGGSYTFTAMIGA